MACHSLVLTFLELGILIGGLALQQHQECPAEDTTCQNDREGFEAICQLHSQIDDNHDGGLNWAESNEFVRDDLKHADGLPKRNFHSNDDFVTVHDLWRLWATSETYNWTIGDVITWLTNHVELPQYVENFRGHKVNGSLLPRFASNSQSFASSLGIKNAVHKQKLAIKATDLVLFGPPKSSHNYVKDFAVMASLLVGAVSAYLAYRQHSRAKYLNHKASKDLSDLQQAEDALRHMQMDLQKAQKEQQTIADDKLSLEKRLQDEIKLHQEEAAKYRLQRDPSDESSELRLAEEELMQVRLALWNAERRLEESQAVPLTELQTWLQLCYEIETKYFEAKKEATEKQLRAAKEMCEKIRKQKGKFLGAFRVAHTTSLDETDHKIMSVRASLEDIKMDMQERMQRWQHIEQLCHFSIISNPGIVLLEKQLKRPERSYPRSLHGPMALDDGDEPMPSTILAQSIHQQSMSDLSFRSGSIASHGHSATGLPPSGLRSRSSKPLLNDNSSQESIPSLDRMTATSEKSNAVVFDLGGELPSKRPLNKNRSTEKLLESSKEQTVSRTESSMPKSHSLPNPTQAQSCSIPNSLSEAAVISSGHVQSTGNHKESQVVKSGASAAKLDRFDDDGNNSSDSISASHDSIGKEKKKKFSLFRHSKPH